SRHTRFSRNWSSDVCSSDLQEYADLGIDTFIFSGYPHLEESYRVAELLFPHLDLAPPGEPQGKQFISPFGEMIASDILPAAAKSGGNGHARNTTTTIAAAGTLAAAQSAAGSLAAGGDQRPAVQSHPAGTQRSGAGRLEPDQQRRDLGASGDQYLAGLCRTGHRRRSGAAAGVHLRPVPLG